MEWLQLPNLNAVPAKRINDLILILYMLSFKRSWLFAMAFVFCNAATEFSFLGFFDSLPQKEYSVCFFLSLCTIWILTIRSQITLNMNRSLAAWCSIMIIFLLTMAWDSWQNADTETFIYSNYATIIVFIHVGIVFSFYRPSATIKLLVDNIRRCGNRLCGNYTVQFICYTVSNYTQIMAQKWLVRTRQL